MALIVKKFGGTSVATLEKIKFVARKIKEDVDRGNQVVVVVSAMAGETDKLESMAYEISDRPDPREFDVLLATGEQVSISLLSIALIKLGCKARSYTGGQVQIITNNVHNKARIIGIETNNILTDLQNGNIAVVAGFQGIDDKGNITTLGRGGSDTTAVALASVLNADECQIFTDVDGVYTTDPRIIPEAMKMDRVTFEEMLELSSLGAKVLQIRAVELAGRYNVPVRVLSTFKEGEGTLVSYGDLNVEQNIVSGITCCREEAKIVLRGVADYPGVAAKILGPLSSVNVEVDMMVQNTMNNGTADFTFTIHRKDLKLSESIISEVAKKLGASEVNIDDKVAKISLVGVGMKSHVGIASQMFYALGQNNVNIQLISTSEIKVSVIVDEKYVEEGIKALHETFNLGKKLEKRLTYPQ